MVGLGVEMAKHLPGLVNTQVDTRNAHSAEKMVKQSLEIVKLYEEAGVPKKRYTFLSFFLLFEKMEVLNIFFFSF